MYICIYVYMDTYTCMYVYVCVYIYMYLCRWSFAIGQVVGNVCMHVFLSLSLSIYTAQAQHASRIHVSVSDACMSVSVMQRADI